MQRLRCTLRHHIINRYDKEQRARSGAREADAEEEHAATTTDLASEYSKMGIVIATSTSFCRHQLRCAESGIKQTLTGDRKGAGSPRDSGRTGGGRPLCQPDGRTRGGGCGGRDKILFGSSTIACQRKEVYTQCRGKLNQFEYFFSLLTYNDKKNVPSPSRLSGRLSRSLMYSNQNYYFCCCVDLQQLVHRSSWVNCTGNWGARPFSRKTRVNSTCRKQSKEHCVCVNWRQTKYLFHYTKYGVLELHPTNWGSFRTPLTNYFELLFGVSKFSIRHFRINFRNMRDILY